MVGKTTSKRLSGSSAETDKEHIQLTNKHAELEGDEEDETADGVAEELSEFPKIDEKPKTKDGKKKMPKGKVWKGIDEEEFKNILMERQPVKENHDKLASVAVRHGCSARRSLCPGGVGPDFMKATLLDAVYPLGTKASFTNK